MKVALVALLCSLASSKVVGVPAPNSGYKPKPNHSANIDSQRSLQTARNGTINAAQVREQSCAAAGAGRAYTTNRSLNVCYFFEIVTDQEPLRGGFEVESAVKDYLIDSLILTACIRSNQTNSSSLPVTDDARGVAVGGSSVLSGTCEELVPSGNLTCFHMLGCNTVFLDDNIEVNLTALDSDISATIARGFGDGAIAPRLAEGVYQLQLIDGNPMGLDNHQSVSKTSAPQASRASEGSSFALSTVGLICVVTVCSVVLAASLFVLLKPSPQEDDDSYLQVLRYRDQVSLGIITGESESMEDEVDITDEIKRYSTDSEDDDQSTVDEMNANPFAPRSGKTLEWRNVNMTVAGKGGKPGRKLLDSVWGQVPHGETTAIIGASGAGKTSLLNVLSGRVTSNGPVTIEADIRLNNYIVDHSNIKVRKMIAFVAQDDSLQVTATPREAILFSAKLRLPRSTSEEQLNRLTSQMLTELGLTACARNNHWWCIDQGNLGGSTDHSRTQEGGDCGAASVLFTIHQPSSEIFACFDRLLMLHKGRVIFNGPVSNVPEYFAERDHPVPKNYNPADWIMFVVQTKPVGVLEKFGFFTKEETLPCDIMSPNGAFEILDQNPREAHMKPPGFLKQVYLLFARECLNIRRDKSAVTARLLLTSILSCLVGTIFLKVGETDSANFSNLQSHFGAIMIGCTMAMLATAQASLLAFPEERPVFLREYSTNHYTVASYFISRLTMEALVTGGQTFVMLIITFFMIQFQGRITVYYAATYVLAMSSTAIATIVGAAAGGNAKVAMQMLPLMFVPQMLFAGFFVTPSLIPFWLRWIQYICPMTYGIRIILADEFAMCGPSIVAQHNCEILLYNTEANADDTWWYWLILIGQFVLFRSIALFILQSNAKRYY